MLDVWDDVTEEERQEVMASFVTRVKIKEKDRASMELSPMPEGYGLKFVTRSQLGAGKGVKANNGFPSIVIKTAPRRPPGMRRAVRVQTPPN